MKKIILIINTGYFGDVLLTSKLTRDIKKYYPNQKLVFICDSPYIQVAKNIPGVDEVVAYDRKINSNLFSYLKFIFTFPYRNKIQHTFIIHQNKRSRKVLAKHLGSKNITTWDNFRFADYNSNLILEDEKYSNVAYLNANMLSVLTNQRTDDEDIEFLIPQEAQEKIDNLLKGYNYKNLVAINPQAGDEIKCWDVDEFIKFMKILIQNGETPVITGVLKDGPAYLDAINNDEQIKDEDYINLIDKTNIEELGALYKRCSFVVSVDTGSAHMSSSVGVPTLVLFFRTDAYLWAPINTKQNSFIYNDFISAEDVLSQMSKQLKEFSQ